MDLFLFFYMLNPVMPAPLVVDAFFLPLYNFRFFVKNQVFIGVWINIWVFDLIPLVLLSIFMPIPDCFLTVALE